MRRRSKEPRRISVVEGRAPASLARVLTTVSCFIYNNETTKRGFGQSLLEHLFSNLSLHQGGGCRLPPKWLLHQSHWTTMATRQLDRETTRRYGLRCRP